MKICKTNRFDLRSIFQGQGYEWNRLYPHPSTRLHGVVHKHTEFISILCTDGKMYVSYSHKHLTDLYWIPLSLHTESQRSANVLIIQNFGHPRLIGSFSCQPEGKISNHPMLRIRQPCTLGAEGWVRGELQKEAICFGPSEGSRTTPRPPTHSYSLTKWSWRCLQVTLAVSLTAGSLTLA